MPRSQAKREIGVTTPLGEDVLLFRRMVATEQLGRLSEFKLDLLSEDNNIKMDDLLGQKMTVRLDLPNGKRYFNGHVSRFCLTGSDGDFACYEAVLRPWLWFLTRTADCRIYQEKTVPEIIKEIFREHGFTDFKEHLSGTYRKWVYCVQYRETDFNFISRLMEHEGIYYFFKHEKDKHTLILADSYSAHEARPGYEKIPYYPPKSNDVRHEEYIDDWCVAREVQPGRYALNDFDFEKPKASLKVKSSMPRQHAQAEHEIYDYPGAYAQNQDGEAYARTRLEAAHAQYEQARGSANVRGISTGGLFQMTGFPRSDQNREYLVSSTNHVLELDVYDSHQSAAPGPVCTCQFTAIESKTPYRPPLATPKPFVQGPQTAIVVGKSGEEIWTDKYGRVKVQFHWDRYGKSDENSSCWVRVSHPWAGKNWGMVAIPRIGQEVVISFLEGDPDQPLITGRVYNADQMAPWDLPANATQSGILSRSSKGAGVPNANAIRMEDKKGAEQLWFHAEKDQLTEVEHDEDKWVGNDRRKTIDGNETNVVHKNRTETVDQNETITVHQNRTERVDLNETISVGLNRTETVGANETVTIAIAKAETVGAAKALTIGAGYAITVGGAMNTAVGLASFEEVGLTKQVIVGKTLRIQAGDSIELVVGKSILVMKKDGTINLNGKDIDITGSKHIQLGADRIDIN